MTTEIWHRRSARLPGKPGCRLRDASYSGLPRITSDAAIISIVEPVVCVVPLDAGWTRQRGVTLADDAWRVLSWLILVAVGLAPILLYWFVWVIAQAARRRGHGPRGARRPRLGSRC